jgi:hypothetical protein
MKRFVVICAVFFAVQMLLCVMNCCAAELEKAVELKMPARDSFREVYNKMNDLNKGAADGVKGQHIKITVSPAELPYPLLKYRFNTYITETESGNAAPLYSEAWAVYEQIRTRAVKWKVYESEAYAKAKFPELFKLPEPKKGEEPVEKLLFKAFPLRHRYYKIHDVITAEEEAAMFNSLKEVYRLVEAASKKRDCDWSYRVEHRGFFTLLPHIQNIRELGGYLAEKAKWEIRNGNYDDAVKSIRLGLRLAEHVENSDMPCLVTLLVGVAIRGRTLEALQLLSSQPDAPNLYPALTQIARSGNIYQKALQCEEFMWMLTRRSPQKIQELFEKIDGSNKEDCKVLVEELAEAIIELNYSNNSMERVDKNLVNDLVAGICVACYPYAKERLLKHGLTEAEADKLSTYQVVTPYIVEQIQAAYDEVLVSAMVPLDSKLVTKELNVIAARADSPLSMYLGLILPAVDASRHAIARMDQFTDLLQITEAIRYYAAVNDGKLPESLDKIEQLHVNKISTVTNKPFPYRVKDNTAIIDFVIYGDKQESRLEITVEKNR